VTQGTPPARTDGSKLPPFDPSVPNPARMWNYWLGGKDNFAADRQAAERVLEVMPSLPLIARAARLFLIDAVHQLATGHGIRQFLDIGTGLPTADNTHDVAQRAAPESKIVYVDYDPVVLTHAQALLTSSPEGQTAYVDADLRDLGSILARATEVLDFSRPVAVMLLGVLHCIPDEDEPAELVAKLMEAVPPGSYLTLSHPASDVAAEQMATSMRAYNDQAPIPLTARSHAEVSRLLAGLDLLDPGVVQLHRWRAGTGDPGTARDLPNYGALARKP
jgi:O-methyltransferase involved in polyketide biosynthesis